MAWIVCALLLCVGTVLAAPLATITTNGSVVSSTVDVVVTDRSGAVPLSSAVTQDDVLIKAIIRPDAAHVGKRADLFAVIRDDSGFYVRDQSGVFKPWNGRIPDLVPAQEGVLLTNGVSFEIYASNFRNAGSRKIYAGYSLNGATYLVYTPIPASFEINKPTVQVSTATYFEDHIEADIIQKRCIACHVEGGLAKDSAMQLQRSGVDSAASNLQAFRKLLDNRSSSFILTKVSGGNNHGGGVQLPVGSAAYNHLATILDLLTGTSSPAPIDNLFNGLVLQSPAQTLRRAAIQIAGRAPTSTELAQVSSGGESVLRATLRNMLQGEGFHRFLTEGANDRLLIEGIPDEVIDINYPFWQTYVQRTYDYKKGLVLQGKPLSDASYDTFRLRMNFIEYGLKRSAAELIAYIVENDRSYKEVLTADYAMVNPQMNQVLNGGATFTDPTNRDEFRPGRWRDYFIPDAAQVVVSDPELGVTSVKSSSKTQVPWKHTGILNDLGFLNRYPSTATNRNRARARWTFYHFMDIDIEKSVQRPTDAAALADRDNPTLKNPACAACHETMDPVAGTFQNYDDDGFYRKDHIDSLDPNYKWPKDGSASPYQHGDLWYRDMRAPGFLGQAITNQDEALKDLAALIVQDPGFARATVKFWWPSVFNADVLPAPGVETDPNYAAKKAAFDAQSALIEQFAAGFMKDYNLKNLLVEMLMSPWFRAASQPDVSKQQAYLQAGLASRQLLTPERLNRKNVALTGYRWGYKYYSNFLQPWESNLETRYRTLMGGIDSYSITRRQREFTPVMSSVAQSMALEAACPIVAREFTLPDNKRRLFKGITDTMTPDNSATRIRQKLAELEFLLLGNSHATNSAHIDALYQLFVDTWQEKQRNGEKQLTYPHICDWSYDMTVFSEITPPKPLQPQGEWWAWPFTSSPYLVDEDSQATKLTWVVIMVYFMSHYQYLYE